MQEKQHRHRDGTERLVHRKGLVDAITGTEPQPDPNPRGQP
jgi:hypothetical protein